MSVIQELSLEQGAARRARAEPDARVVFQVADLYGISLEGLRMPLSEDTAIDSGPVTITLDPQSAPAENIGVIDYEARSLRVRYGVQGVFQKDAQ
jgi:hypothetical protein